MEIDDNIPGGNVVVEQVEGDIVTIRPDYRDTAGYWFYWHFRIRGAGCRTVTVKLGHEKMVSEMGPAVSRNAGGEWRWMGRDAVKDNSFQYRIPDGAGDVRFSMGMPYTLDNLSDFLDRLGRSDSVDIGELARTRKNRPVYMVRAGKIGGGAGHRIIAAARHHCCEMMASYTMEGLLEGVVADDATGRWFRNNVELLAIPFADTDGVEDGDQGKNRSPRDHNRDYSGDSIHVETAAIRDFVPDWSDGKLDISLDLHCPYIQGGDYNHLIYMVGSPDEGIWKEQRRFGKIMEDVRSGPLPYYSADNLPFGRGWNTGANFSEGASFTRWAAGLDGMKLATSIEIPYSAAHGVEVNPRSARLLGRDIARAIYYFITGAIGE